MSFDKALYGIWYMMAQRCYNPTNPAYPLYGGKGVKICDRWRESFQAFVEDMGPRPSPDHSIDRFPDKNGNYGPGNCRWATSKQQNRNRRDNRILTAFGQSRCLADWAEELGMPARLLALRLWKGW